MKRAYIVTSVGPSSFTTRYLAEPHGDGYYKNVTLQSHGVCGLEIGNVIIQDASSSSARFQFRKPMESEFETAINAIESMNRYFRERRVELLSNIATVVAIDREHTCFTVRYADGHEESYEFANVFLSVKKNNLKDGQVLVRSITKKGGVRFDAKGSAEDKLLAYVDAVAVSMKS